MKKTDYGKIIKAASNITHLGLIIVIPMFICISATIYIKHKWNLGTWVVLSGIIIGLSAGILNLYKIAKRFIKEAKDHAKEYGPTKLTNYDEGKDEQ